MTTIWGSRILYEDGAGQQAGQQGGQQGGQQAGQEGGQQSVLTGQQAGQEGGQQTNGQQRTFSPENWREALPEDLRSDQALAKYQNFEDLARGVVNSQRLIGKDPNSLVEVPAERSLENLKPVLQKLGLPENADGYQLKAGEGVSEALKPDSDLAKGFIQKAHEIGVLPEQAQAVYDWFASTMGETMSSSEEAQAEQAAENIQTLQTEFGQAFDAKIAAADRAVEKFGGKELREEINNSPLATSPRLIKFLASVGDMLQEDGGDGHGSGEFGRPVTPAEAKARADDLTRRANELPFNDPERRRLTEEAVKIRARGRGEKLDF